MAIQAKISERSKKVLQEIVHLTGESQIEVIEHAVLAYRRQWRMERLSQAYAKLKKDARAWKEELRERSELEKTIGDGLEDE